LKALGAVCTDSMSNWVLFSRISGQMPRGRLLGCTTPCLGSSSQAFAAVQAGLPPDVSHATIGPSTPIFTSNNNNASSSTYPAAASPAPSTSRRTASACYCTSAHCQHSLIARTGLSDTLPACDWACSKSACLLRSHNSSMSASPTSKHVRTASPALPKSSAGYSVAPLQLPIHGNDEPRRTSIAFQAHRNSSLPRGSPRPRERRRLSSPPPPP
jgi:hypothetical protein